jgi:radical SAM protein with 4Fe4S-binding SPASM domain
MLSYRSRNRFHLLKNYIRGNPLVSGGPLTLAIESTAKCNLSCPMCMRASVYFPPRDMELRLFKKIIDESKAFLEFAVPYGAGEPLLNPEIFEMISYCRNAGVPTGISTNATLLNADRAGKLIASGLDSIIFAFDGATRESYQKYRKGADFEKVRENILTFLRVKNEMRARIFCILQMVRLRENRREFRDLVRMWRVKGMNEIRIKKDEVYNEECAVPGETQPLLRNPCYLLWRGPMYIHYDGTVFPCCYIYPEEAIGNVKRTPLIDIWNSDGMIRLREAHVKRDLSCYPTCQNCPAARPKPAAVFGSFLINTHAARRVIPFFERMALIRNLSIFEALK